jgi:predicted DNA-binding antitoxin AbrB/MazE fold protein
LKAAGTPIDPPSHMTCRVVLLGGEQGVSGKRFAAQKRPLKNIRWTGIFGVAAKEAGEMVRKRVDAIYEQGILRPLSPLSLREGERICLVVESMEEKEDIFSLAFSVYEGLSEEEIQEVEQIALERKDFFGEGV